MQYLISLPEGKYGFTVTAPGWQDYVDSVTVSSESVVAFVSMIKAFSIQFIVGDNSGNIENAEVTIGEITLTTDVNGEATFEGFAAGKYGYSVSAAGHEVYTDSVEVTNADVVETIMLVTTGIEDFKKANISVYPNPTSDFINVSIPATNKEIQLILRNSHGGVVKHFRYSNSTLYKMDIQNVASGMYFLEVRYEGQQNSIKIIKQ